MYNTQYVCIILYPMIYDIICYMINITFIMLHYVMLCYVMLHYIIVEHLPVICPIIYSVGHPKEGRHIQQTLEPCMRTQASIPQEEPLV